MAIIARPEESLWTYGVGVFGVAGFRSNYPASNTNPLLTGQPPMGLGLGRIEAQAQVFQIVPTAALQLTDRLAIGVAPTITVADFAAEPGFFGAPDDANFFTYAPATGSRYFWGGGVQAGIYYDLTEFWHLGASLKSPQWFETLRFESNDEIGGSRELEFGLDLPLVASIGASYTGIERFTFAVDARYFDYENTDGFGDSGFASTGEVKGLGWRSIFAVAAGVQYELCDCTSLRLGYSFNENPIPGSNTMLNAGVPLQLQHTVYAGASYRVSCNMDVHVAYAHAFESEISGPFVTPLGPLPGTSITSDVAVDSVTVGATIRF
jgi:long-chain fatty acid transport protein